MVWFERQRGAEQLSDTIESIHADLTKLKAALVAQGEAVREIVAGSIDALFDKDEDAAKALVLRDEAIDSEDIRIEKAAVRLLSSIACAACDIPQHDLRMILTIVKVNNEFERIADLAVDIAERVPVLAQLDEPPPAKFRIAAHSVIGIATDTVKAFDRMDNAAAQLVLATDDTTEQFNAAILRDVEQSLSEGRHSVDFAFALNTIAHALERIADHCTNVAEQTIYVTTGKIVRHTNQKWSDPTDPDV